MSRHPNRRLPAEWEPQRAVMLTWPHPDSDWHDTLDQVEPVFVAIAAAISAHQPLIIACHSAPLRDHVATQLQAARVDAEQVTLAIAPTNDVWARDHGPIMVLDGEQRQLLQFDFNGWGQKYRFHDDARISERLHAAGAFGDLPLQRVALVLEGGSIDSDGAGTLLTTSQCLLAPARNAGYDRAGLTQVLQRLFNLQRIIWLDHGYLLGDDTDSHIDTLARFCDRHTIAYVTTDEVNDPHYAELQAMAQQLQQLRDRTGQPYRLIALPLPAAQYDSEGERMPATYANFLIINGAVLVPTYHDAADAIALQRLATAFPDRQIIGIDARPLIAQHGSLHCVTMQLPR